MATLKVFNTFDFSNVTLSGIDTIDFDNLGASATATFLSSQFDDSHIFRNVHIQGSFAGNNIVVNGTHASPYFGATFSAANWTFSSWNSAVDTITINGTAKSDFLTGSSQNDVIIGGTGYDVLHGGGGNDTFVYNTAAEIGNDVIDGGAGTADTILVNASGALDFTATTISGIEVLRLAGPAATSITLSGSQIGASNGLLQLASANGIHDTLTVTGNAIDLSGVQFIAWENFADQIILNGTAGNDIIAGTSLSDFMNGGDGIDTVSYAGHAGGVTVYLDFQTGTSVGTELDHFFNFENVIGSAFGDVLFGDAGNNSLLGGDGDDLIDGRGGADALNGGAGRNILSYTGSAAGVTVNLANGTGSGGDAQGDVIVNFTDIRGSGLADSLTGDGNSNFLEGRGGADILMGAGGADFFEYFSSSDCAPGEVVDGGDGADTILVLGGGTFDFSATTILSVETLSLRTQNDATAILAAPQIGGTGDIAEVVGTNGKQTLTVIGSDINLSAVAFVNWTDDDDRINLTGTNGSDVIIGSGHADHMLGGNGGDIFGFGRNALGQIAFGNDVISDFGNGRDVIRLDHTILADFADVQAHMSQVGASAVITLDANNSISLSHVTASQLVANDFLFV
jgi:Ca2+-binding RTX toxin-like protein